MASDNASDPTNRASLTQRILPHMTLSDGSAIPPATTPATPPGGEHTPQTAAAAAAARFAIPGGAIISGGGGVLGLATARALLEHSCPAITLFDLNPTLSSARSARGIEQLREDFQSSVVETKAVDCTDARAVEVAVRETAAVYGNSGVVLRHVLCFAGIVNVTPALDEDSERVQRVFGVNALGSFNLAVGFARWWTGRAVRGAEGEGRQGGVEGEREREKGEGGVERQRERAEGDASIMFTASLGASQVLFPQPQMAYNMSKSAVVSMTKNLAAEWAVDGIRVNCIAPGYMDTVLNEGPGLESARQAWMSRCPMGRMGQPEELGGVAVMLCSRAGRYITGVEIAVDGGSSVF